MKRLYFSLKRVGLGLSSVKDRVKRHMVVFFGGALWINRRTSNRMSVMILEMAQELAFWGSMVGDKNFAKIVPIVLYSRNQKIWEHYLRWDTNYYWCLCPLRLMTVDKQLQAGELTDKLERIQFKSCGDSLTWQSRESDYIVKSLHSRLKKKHFYKCSIKQKQLFPTLKVWHTKAPSKVSFYLWLVINGRALTQDWLKKRGVRLANRCPFVGGKRKSILVPSILSLSLNIYEITSLMVIGVWTLKQILCKKF